MSEALVDYVMRRYGANWAVYRRTLDLPTNWLQVSPVSIHCAQAEAEAAMHRIIHASGCPIDRGLRTGFASALVRPQPKVEIAQAQAT